MVRGELSRTMRLVFCFLLSQNHSLRTTGQCIIDPSKLGKVAEEGVRSPTRIQPSRNIPIPNQGMDNEA
jgi:hypothetical protein